MIAETSQRITDNDIRIIRLQPVKVAWYRAQSAGPEKDAWDVMRKWMGEQGLAGQFSTRYFGFNNPNPVPGNPVYGYEVWVTVMDESIVAEKSGPIGFKEFEGGLYAVTPTRLPDITEQWKQLCKWVETSGYTFGSHQWLEENIMVDEKSWDEDMQLDLYCPIRKKDK